MCRADRSQTDVGDQPPFMDPCRQAAERNRLGVPRDRELSTVEKMSEAIPLQYVDGLEYIKRQWPGSSGVGSSIACPA